MSLNTSSKPLILKSRLHWPSVGQAVLGIGVVILAVLIMWVRNLVSFSSSADEVTLTFHGVFWALGNAVWQVAEGLFYLIAGLILYMALSFLIARLTGLRLGRGFVLAGPFTWLFLFFLLPFAIVLKISFAIADVAIPPYTELLTYADQQLDIALNFGNYLMFTDDPLYLDAYLGSLKIAGISTLICLLIGYPMAYAIARARKDVQTVLLLLIMMPTWTAILIRVYAWMGLLSTNGLINEFLMFIGVIHEPLRLLNTNFAVYLGIVYSYLPFMILPLFANLVKHDLTLLEAASDLGASRFTSFWRITVPLSKNGIIAGCMLVFIPAVGEFVIPELLGGPETLMIGRVLWQEFFNNRDWPVASALAVVMLIILIVPIVLFNRNQAKELEGKL